eukprot:5328052-Amphidinium_carterae.2
MASGRVCTAMDDGKVRRNLDRNFDLERFMRAHPDFLSWHSCEPCGVIFPLVRLVQDLHKRLYYKEVPSGLCRMIPKQKIFSDSQAQGDDAVNLLGKRHTDFYKEVLTACGKIVQAMHISSEVVNFTSHI